MKITTPILTFTFALLMVMPSTVAAAYYADADGWPNWIGRNDNLYVTSKQRPEMAAKYLPLSLIKTGGFEKMVAEVNAMPNVDTTKWPTWIGELISQ
jgi:hypothetical protein